MSKAIPWAEGRVAQLIEHHDGGVCLNFMHYPEQVVGALVDGVRIWQRQNSSVGWRADGALCALRFGQCPECYEVGEHGAGCRIAENLRRGVPAFWARWAHFEKPAQTVATVYQWSGCDLVRMHDAADLGSQPEWVVDCGDCEGDPAVDGRPWVAIGLDGAPTNEPWEG